MELEKYFPLMKLTQNCGMNYNGWIASIEESICKCCRLGGCIVMDGFNQLHKMNNECEPMKSNLRDEIKHVMDECDIIICIRNQWMSVVKNGWDCYSKEKIVVTESNWYEDECDPIGWTSTMDKLNISVTHCTNFIGWNVIQKLVVECDLVECCGDEWEEFW